MKLSPVSTVTFFERNPRGKPKLYVLCDVLEENAMQVKCNIDELCCQKMQIL
jgi:hypothetical protein